MTYSDDDIRAQLRLLFEFAHINKWCTQLDDRIAALLAAVPDDDHERFRTLLEREYTGTDAHNEQAVLVVLLGLQFGGRVIDATERIFDRLRGRLDLGDQNFISAHLFQRAGPLPPDVTYDIVTRPYLSFRRAIGRAMGIQTVSSTFTAAEVALYLTLIMCRVDINEQNRAMISLLLSRIDAELPRNLTEGMFVYLRSLKTIIAEVEGQGEAVLAAEFNYADEPTIDPEPPPASEPEPPAAQSPQPDAQAREQAQTDSAQDQVAPDRKPRPSADRPVPPDQAPPQPERRPAPLSQTAGPRDRAAGALGVPGDNAVRPNRESAAGPTISDGATRTRLGAIAPVQQTAARPAELGTVAAAQNTDRYGGIEAAESNSAFEQNVDRPSDQLQPTPDEEPQENTIHFNRNTSELLRLIDELDRDDQAIDSGSPESVTEEEPVAHAAAEEQPAASRSAATSAPKHRAGLRRTAASDAATPKRKQRKVLRYSGILAGGAFLLALVVALVLRTDRSVGPPPVAPGSVAAAVDRPARGSQIEPEAAADLPDASQQAPAPAASDSAVAAADTADAPIDPQQSLGSLSETPLQPQPQPQPQPSDTQSFQTPALYRVELDGGQFVWTVQNGQTGWGLFNAAAGAPLTVSQGLQYTVPPQVSWLQYILDLFAANPSLQQFTIITPGQRIVLPDYR